ncbi:ATP-binding cassette domain-containing protein, partial [Corynebacterium sp.]|uniref:ATP-binding cassette domain-containing protein n=1 Tax=Corynebacterium sp. TaxID=1720 RepID=UPI0026DDA5EA
TDMSTTPGHRYTTLTDATTRRLYVTQSVILTCTIFLLIVSIGLHTDEGGVAIMSAIISAVGVAIAAITPLQSVGFGVSSLAVAIAHYRESNEKIRPELKDSSREDLEHISSSIRALTALVDLHAKEVCNRPIWVTGPSGSGKTTVLEGFLGLNEFCPTAFAPADGDAHPTAYTPQQPGLLHTTACENVTFGRRAHSDDEANKLLERLDLAGLMSSVPSGQRLVAGEDSGVSGGEKQRITLARSLLTPPGSLIVLDEPTSGLDKISRARVWKLIEEKARTSTIIVSTHDESAPMRTGDPQLAVNHDSRVT